MKVLIVHAHPESKSFNGALTQRAVATLTSEGHEVLVSDLYAMGFHPVSDRSNFTTIADPDYYKQQTEEAYAADHNGFTPEILSEIEKVEWCDVLIFQFPLWWFGLPAILKGWVDRVLAYKRTYGDSRMFDAGVFAGKRALVSTTTGGGATAYSPRGVTGDIHKILYPIQHGIFAFVGFDVLPPFVAYAVAHGTDADRAAQLDAWDDRLRALSTTAAIVWTPGLADIDEAYVDAVPRFLVHALWAREPPAELAAAESAAVERLQAQGILKSRHVAADHGQAWLELRAPDSETVQRHLKTLPLYEYLKFEVTMLGV